MSALNTAARFAARWLLPAGAADAIRRRVGSQAARRPKGLPSAIVAANRELRNIHAGQRCFILATGPSVQTQDLTGLAGEVCIAVSHFFLHKDIDRIDPAYHVVAPYHPPFDFQTLRILFDGFSERYDDRVTYLMGHTPYEHSVWNFLGANPGCRRERMYFVDYTDSVQLSEDDCRRPEVWDLDGRPFEPRTVIYTAIQAAAYMGFSEIYLLGCDHDYLNDTTRVTNHHFYREEEGVSDAEHLSAFTTERWFKEYYFRWMQYRLMRDHLDSRGVTIYNATAGGMLDVFGRVDLADVLAGDAKEQVAHVR